MRGHRLVIHAALALLLVVTPAMASRRRTLPLPVAVAMSDSIVLATVTDAIPARHNSEMTLTIDKVLSGRSPGDTVHARSRDSWSVGDKLIVHLDRVGGIWRADDGTVRDTPEARAKRLALIQHTPTWPAPVEGWSMVFVVLKNEITAGEQLDGFVVYRNQTEEDQMFSYREWPPAQHTRWNINVTRDDQPLAPTPHPTLTPAGISDYFSEHGNTYDLPMSPGQCWPIGLDRLNSAEQGWGYKQRIGYQFWDLSVPGTYTFTATDAGFPDRAALSAPPVQVVVLAKPKDD